MEVFTAIKNIIDFFNLATAIPMQLRQVLVNGVKFWLTSTLRGRIGIVRAKEILPIIDQTRLLPFPPKSVHLRAKAILVQAGHELCYLQ